jgi:multidrug efflux pump subunit AcrB
VRGVIAWFARNTVAANLMMVFIIVAGLTTLGTIRLEVFPEVSADMVSVTVPYLGAAPKEVEEGVCVRIEEAIQDLDGVKKITSTATEGVGSVLVEAVEGVDLRKLVEEVKARVDSIETFPEETERPRVQEVLLRMEVLNLAISGEADEASLKQIAEVVRDDLLSLPSITQVEVSGARPYEISIEVSEEAMRRWGLTFEQVAASVRSSSLDMPGGTVRTEGGEILLRTKGQAYRGREFEDLTVLARPDGTRLRLGDVARVVDGFAETDQISRFDGKPGVVLRVFRVGDQNALQIAREVEQYLETTATRLPDGIEVTLWQADTKVLLDRLNLLLRNARTGFLLVFLVLALFLKLRLAMWVAAGIAVSFTGAFWMMPVFDVSINAMSLFAFIIVLGIVVDDAIVVGENVYRHLELGSDPLAASIRGTQEVAVPVVFSILTSVAAFGTFLNAPGAVGKIMVVVPIIAVSTLFFSMIESLFILPAHLSHLRHSDERGASAPYRFWMRVQGAVSSALQRLIERAYLPTLRWALEWRYFVLAVGVAAMILTLGAMGAGLIKLDYMPDIEADNAVVTLTMPQGTPVDVTLAALAHIEEQAAVLDREFSAEGHEGLVRHVLTTVGDQPFSLRSQQFASFNVVGGVSGSHLGEVNIELAPSEERDVSSAEVARRWRELTGAIPDAVELSFAASLMSIGADLDVQLASRDLDVLRVAAQRVQEELRKYPAVADVNDTFRPGKREIALEITPQGEALGLSLADVARQVRQGFYGEEAQRIQRGRDDVRVMVRYSRSERESLASLETMRLRTAEGVEIPFSVAARGRFEEGFADVTRIDRRRTVNVRADVDNRLGNANEIRGDLEARVLPRVLAEFPGVSYSFAGMQEEQAESLDGAGRSFGAALLLIFILLAIPFRSYLQPLIVMSAIPFGLIGAVLGHAILGMSVTALSIFGLVALTGVVVNDSLVLVDFVNRSYRSGTPLSESLESAGRSRFRPILLTSLTTFAGLTPLLLEQSMQAEFLKPMGASLGFGVLFATPVILILVPVLYRVLEDVRLFGSWLRGPSRPRTTAAEAR